MKVHYSIKKEWTDRVNKLKKNQNLDDGIAPRKLRTYPTRMKGRVQAFNNIASQTLQRSKHKMVGKREENVVSTPHVLSMISYAHIQAKILKR